MGINSNIRGGAGAGRGDDAHGVTNVNRFSATTRKANPAAGGASGSQASFNVSNSGGQAAGEGMQQVRAKYKASRQAGMSPDDSRGAALSEYSYSGVNTPKGTQGPRINMATDYTGKSV